MARSKFVESFNLAQNECSVDDPEVLAPNGYGIDNWHMSGFLDTVTET